MDDPYARSWDVVIAQNNVLNDNSQIDDKVELALLLSIHQIWAEGVMQVRFDDPQLSHDSNSFNKNNSILAFNLPAAITKLLYLDIWRVVMCNLRVSMPCK